jgi:hypothetical protein
MALVPLLTACSNNASNPTGPGNVQVQVQNTQGVGGGTAQMRITAPRNSENFTLTATQGDPSTWHRYKMDLQVGDQVTFSVPNLISRVCTVGQFAIDETYARALVVEDGTNWSEDGGTAPPGPTVHCECGFQEYGSQNTTNNC